MSSNEEKVDLKNLFEGNNFEKWARRSFANDEFSNNLNTFININYGDSLQNLSEEALQVKLNNICDEIIQKYEIDEYLLREFNKSGFCHFHISLNNLEMSIKKLDILQDIYDKTNELAKKLGVPDSSETIVIDDDEEISISTPDDDVQIVTLSSRIAQQQPVKQVLDLPASLQFMTSRELLNGFQARIKMPVLVKADGDIWLKGVIENIENKQSNIQEQKFDVRLENEDLLTSLQGFLLANIKSSLTHRKIYPVGTRIVSIYADENGCIGYYSGIVAEPPGNRNNYRYLVFFDDGYTQYSCQYEIYLVFQQSIDNWKLMNKDSQEFVRSYMERYPERPMVRMKVGQTVKVEYNCEWCPTTVEKIDASLALIFFGNGHREWIYRGSTRIEALYREIIEKPKGKGKRSTMTNVKSNRPVVEYTRSDSLVKTSARKTTSKQRLEPDTNPYVNYNLSDIDLAGMFITTLDNILKTRSLPTYTAHTCNHSCMVSRDNTNKDKRDLYKGHNPLEIPIHSGWFRVKSVPSGKNHTSKASIYYVSPCGHRLRNISELDNYLIQTECQQTIDLFSFEVDVRVNREFQVLKVITQIADISYGKENVKIPCVNSVDNDVPPYIDYMPWRHKFDDDSNLVALEEDPNFLLCCDCTDNCKNKLKCACHHLTAEYSRHGTEHRTGYVNRRLHNFHPGGVFECNSRCSCNQQCRNKVVQHGLWNKLQIFKTEKKGWGIRTLHDIPKGAFICIYAGTIYDEESAVEEGKKFGDEYQAELDYIETIEETKDGYESGVEEPENSNEDSENDQAKAELLADSEDSESTTSHQSNTKATSFSEKIEQQLKLTEAPNDKIIDVYQPNNPLVARVEGNFGNPDIKSSKTGGRRHTSMHVPKVNKDESSSKKFNIRDYLGDSNPFIMDAKRAGNLGRYFNHSCSPNLFVQNVFITSHDLRYPEVAFFSKRNIEAGEEITWDYMYRVGSVPDKVLYCYCGSTDCRGRLL